MLQIDYLSAGSSDCPLLRIAGIDVLACKTLQNGLARLADGRIDRLEIDNLPGVISKEGCRLAAIAGDWDRGIIVTKTAYAFEWVLTRETWGNVAGLVEPFAASLSGSRCQWLESAGEIRVLITTSGDW